MRSWWIGLLFFGSLSASAAELECPMEFSESELKDYAEPECAGFNRSWTRSVIQGTDAKTSRESIRVMEEVQAGGGGGKRILAEIWKDADPLLQENCGKYLLTARFIDGSNTVLLIYPKGRVLKWVLQSNTVKEIAPAQSVGSTCARLKASPDALNDQMIFSSGADDGRENVLLLFAARKVIRIEI